MSQLNFQCLSMSFTNSILKSFTNSIFQCLLTNSILKSSRNKGFDLIMATFQKLIIVNVSTGLKGIIMHQSIPPAPSPPPPGQPRGICQPCQSRGRGFSLFSTTRGPGIGQPQWHPRPLTRAWLTLKRGRRGEFPR